ncbi:AP-1 complex-associated regulatory protein-like isoform X1 [Scleropages formosus]|uniref:AP-1 complex-associated regulatory protein-like isoform X1 n=1 Tax=Scleropages formosus TaxID=113540 RepID=UPI0010FA9896|nr:AP-1 complex-associated regulatory protein isoform X1 [Scleropages formosus]
MGACWTQCCGLIRREASRIGRPAGASMYFRSSTTGEHYTIEFENLVESDEAESPGSTHRVISEVEMAPAREHHYAAVCDKQLVTDGRIKVEHMRVKTGGGSLGDGQKILPSGYDCERYLQNSRATSEPFRSSRLYSEANVATPNTESSYDFTSKTRSTDGDGTSLDLEWEDEEGMTRVVLVRERSHTEEDILQAALRSSRAPMGSGTASDESNALEWENDFASLHAEVTGGSEYYGFINPLLDMPPWDPADDSGSDKQDR